MQPLTFRDIPEDPSRPDLVREAWADFRGIGYADLKAVQNSLNQRAESLYKDGEGGWTASGDHKALVVLKARAHAIGMLMQWIEENGANPPEWSDLVAPKKTREWAQKAHPHLEESVGVRGLCRLLAEKEGVSESTPYKWLCAKNPLYLGDEHTEETEHLREVIKRICSRNGVNSPPS